MKYWFVFHKKVTKAWGEGDAEKHCCKRELCFASNNQSIFTKKSDCIRAYACEFFMMCNI